MKKGLLLVFLVLLFPSMSFAKAPLPDEQIKQAIIQQSIKEYHGSCPCPYSVAKSRYGYGSSCGKRSAYSRPGGAAPICYPKQVTQAMIDNYRAENK